MGIKYKLKLKDLKLEYLIEYFKPILKFFKPKEKINNYEDLKNYIQKKSAWISQVTLYGYLKTRMGAKHVLMFEDEIFLGSINKAKWNIYSVALQDLTFFSFSYLNVFFNYDDIIKSKDIFFSILDKEKINGMPDDVFNSAKKSFEDRFQKVDWKKYYNSLPFNESALALYHWAPIADELKTLDRKIVLNSMILKWDNIKDEFTRLINI